MPVDNFYTITKPVEWARSPSVFSYSVLQAIQRCPLQWQLLHSKYGPELRKFPARPSPAAVEGDIVHSVLEKLFRALSLIGLPSLGTPEFRDCIARVSIKEEIASRISSHEKLIANHPRGNGFRLRSSPQQLVNKVTRLFRGQYSDLSASSSPSLPVPGDTLIDSEVAQKTCEPSLLLKKFGALSEFKVKHSTIPFVGIIDFIFQEEGQPVVVDFKTGQPNKDHLKQVMTYAILWKSKTAQVPKRLEVRYPQIVDFLQMDDSKLLEAEEQLSAEIGGAVATLSEKPAKALLGEQCCFCDVRQFCDAFWNHSGLKPLLKDKSKFIDISLTVEGVPTDYGFEGKSISKDKLVVMFTENTSKFYPVVRDGQNLRILSALGKGNEIIIKPRTEIYFVDS